MEKTISRIFEIEEKANLIIDRANKEKIQLYSEFENNLIQMEQRIADETTTRIKDYQEKTDKELSEESLIFAQKCEQQLQELDLFYNENHNNMIQKVYENIISS